MVLGALNYGKLPFVNSNQQYSAYFAEAGGLLTGPRAGFGLQGRQGQQHRPRRARVLVTFEVDKGIRLGDRTEAAIKTKSVLGAKILELTPRGDGRQSGPIPLERTKSPYQLPDALGDLDHHHQRAGHRPTVGFAGTCWPTTFSDTPPALQDRPAGRRAILAYTERARRSAAQTC